METRGCHLAVPRRRCNPSPGGLQSATSRTLVSDHSRPSTGHLAETCFRLHPKQFSSFNQDSNEDISSPRLSPLQRQHSRPFHQLQNVGVVICNCSFSLAPQTVLWADAKGNKWETNPKSKFRNPYELVKNLVSLAVVENPTVLQHQLR